MAKMAKVLKSDVDTVKLNARKLAVRSVPRFPGESDAFALGYDGPDGPVWYAHHIYRAVDPAAAVRFPTAVLAWDTLTKLTGRPRPYRIPGAALKPFLPGGAMHRASGGQDVPDDMICPGHESLNGPIGNVEYCDGTCAQGHRADAGL